MAIQIDVIFDVAEGSPYFAPTMEAVRHAASAGDGQVAVNVVRTNEIDAAYLQNLPDALLIGPGTPYQNPGAAEAVIAHARTRGIPLVAT